MKKLEFTKLCRKHGITYRIEDNTLRVDLPQGKVLVDSGFHFLEIWLKGWSIEDAYDSAASDIRSGIENCDDEECDYCAVR